ncbi:MAG: FecR domain-containing protein [Elusimicrobia bacterium]|nr:FecR domain-containing protein [Elusimicrobiota bacterium]
MKSLPLIAVLTCLLAAPAGAAMRVAATTGVLSAGGKTLKPGDVVPDAEVSLSSGAAVLTVDGGRFLVTGPARFTPGKKQVRLGLGSWLSVLTRKAGRTFSVKTPAAVAAVRGTDFYVGVGPAGETDVCICDGKLEVTGDGMAAIPLAAKHHLNYRFISSAGKTSGAKAAMIGHTDAELKDLHARLAAPQASRDLSK